MKPSIDAERAASGLPSAPAGSFRPAGAPALRNPGRSIVPWILFAAMFAFSSCSRETDSLRDGAGKGDPSAQFGLAVAYANGQGVAKDLAEAAKWLGKAAAQGHLQAQFNLGVAHANALGVPRDPSEAVKWFRLAAERGHPGAQNNLGAAYSNGLGVPRDDAEAVKWHRMAAEQGHPQAQANLGMAYRNGRGVPRDELQSYFWFSLAADGSDGKAREWLARTRDQAAGSLSSSRRMEAQRMIAEWKARHPEALTARQ